jgi:ATP-dependent Lon protease
MVRSYLEWLVELPRSKFDPERIDIDAAQQILKEDRYGLDKVKRRLSGGTQAQSGQQESHTLLRRPSRRRQDVPRPEHRARNRSKVRDMDKLGIGFHGDPAAALLEVLDSEQ